MIASYYKIVSSSDNYSAILSKLREEGIDFEPDNGSELLPIATIEVFLPTGMFHFLFIICLLKVYYMYECLVRNLNLGTATEIVWSSLICLRIVGNSILGFHICLL